MKREKAYRPHRSPMTVKQMDTIVLNKSIEHEFHHFLQKEKFKSHRNELKSYFILFKYYVCTLHDHVYTSFQ